MGRLCLCSILSSCWDSGRQSDLCLERHWSHGRRNGEHGESCVSSYLLLKRKLNSSSSHPFQFSSVHALSHVWLWDPMNHSTPGLPVHYQLPESTQTHVRWVRDAIQPSHPLSSPSSSCLQSFPASGSFLVSQFFVSGGQSIGVSALASILPMTIQGWFPLLSLYWLSFKHS